MKRKPGVMDLIEMQERQYASIEHTPHDGTLRTESLIMSDVLADGIGMMLSDLFDESEVETFLDDVLEAYDRYRKEDA
ncbi:hypothetical protein [Hydrogenimonas sp.]